MNATGVNILDGENTHSVLVRYVLVQQHVFEFKYLNYEKIILEETQGESSVNNY